MIPRYNRPVIEEIWSLENKFKIWTEIECLIAEKQSMLGIIPKKSAKEIRKKAKFNVKEIEKIEKETKHDVVAYINNVSKYIGDSSKYFHFGVTSSDIIDTSFSVQLKQTAEIIRYNLKECIKNLKIKSRKYKNTIMIGRSHGIHAEPITFGLKLASFYFEFKRNLERFDHAIKGISICAISGPVGTFNSIDPSVQDYVAKPLTSENIPEDIVEQFMQLNNDLERCGLHIDDIHAGNVRLTENGEIRIVDGELYTDGEMLVKNFLVKGIDNRVDSMQPVLGCNRIIRWVDHRLSVDEIVR